MIIPLHVIAVKVRKAMCEVVPATHALMLWQYQQVWHKSCWH